MRNFFADRGMLAVVAVTASLAPFINKAFHIDDTLFIWMAHQISQHPCDPYGFSVNWYSTVEPMFLVMQNPPLSSYYAALAASLFGWSEPAMHSAFLVPAIAAALGTFFLARRLSDSPLFAVLFTIFTPVFLVSATTVMCDTWLLALWVWSINCWLSGLERNSGWILALGAILAAFAALTKYFGLSLVPLLIVFTLVRDRRFTLRLLLLLLPLIAIGIYEEATKAKYGVGLFSNAIIYPWVKNSKAERQLLKPLLTGLSFTGGCLISVLFYAPLLKCRKVLKAGLAIFIALLSVFYFVMARGFNSEAAVTVTAEGALFVTTAIGILALALTDLAQRKTADSLLLCLWVIGTSFFATFMNWSVTSRTLLPITPAIGILLARWFNTFRAGENARVFARWPILSSAIVSLLIAAADYRLANTARTASRQFKDHFQSELGTVWFEGHWGFQYYMEQWKAKPLDTRRFKMLSGDVLIISVNNTNVRQLPIETMVLPEQVHYSQFLLATVSPEVGAGFYSSIWGPLPWAIGHIPPQRFDVLRVR